MWSNLGIRQKVFTLFTIIALLPLVIINVIWLRSSQQQLKQAAATRQSIFLSSSAQRLNDSLDAKVNSVITHSQEFSVTNINTDQAKINLLQFANQDSDILRIALIDSNGNEKVVVNNHALSNTLTNVKSSEAFKVVTQISNDVSIGDVMFDNEQPKIVIAVPLFSDNRLGDQNLTNAQALARRYGADIKGALVVDIGLSNVWKSITSAELGSDGYAYIVDSHGRLIAHHDPDFLRSHLSLRDTAQVAKFLKAPADPGATDTTISEKNVKVLSGHYPIKRTGWAVVAEEPYDSILAPATHVTRLAIFILAIAGVTSLLFSFLFSRNLTRPIRSLVAGTAELGLGNLDMRIATKSKDEIGVLATRFNTMAGNLKQLISNLQTESTKLNVVLDNVGEGIVAMDSQNHIVLVNIAAAVLAGTLPSDLIGKSFEDVFNLSKNNQPFKLQLENSEVYKIYKEVVFISPNKRLHYLDIFINKIKDDPNDIRNIITFLDQTDERELEMMKLDFVSMAAHELRTPITAIRGYLSLLSIDNESKLSDDSKQSIERAQSSTTQLVGLIGNLLNVSKIERGTLNMNYSKIDWAETVQDIVHDNEFSAEDKHIALRYDGPAEGVPLLADEVAIKEVISNLVANAINYTDDDGHITVGVKVEDDRVITSVKDDGIGIPLNAQQRLFTKFYRVKGGMASGSGGTGLGLYISRSIVELHKGKIWVESEPGVGTTFAFSLPAYDEVQYNELVSKQITGVKKRRGWTTKNTTR